MNGTEMTMDSSEETTEYYLSSTFDNGNTTNDMIILDTTYDMYLVPTIWGIIFLAGIAGNSLVVYVMLRYGDINTTNCYMVNLAVTDLLFIVIVIPFTLMNYILPSWIFGRSMCKFHQYMIYVCLHATCLTLTAMSIDRYFAIVHPIKSISRRTPKVAVIVSAATWVVSLLVSIPFAVFLDLKIHRQPNLIMCEPTWRSDSAASTAMTYVVVMTYVIPLSIITVCYIRILQRIWRNKSMARPSTHLTEQTGSGSRIAPPGGMSLVVRLQNQRRQKTAKMVGMVILLFATCWLPIHIFQLWQCYTDIPRTEAMYVYKIFAHACSFANSCVNPIVYSFIGGGFRKAVKKAFPKCFGANPVHPSATSETPGSARPNVRRTVSSSMTASDGDVTRQGAETRSENVHGRRTRCGSPRQEHVMLSRQRSLPGDSSRSQLHAVVEELAL